MEAQEELLEMERKFEALQSSVLAAHLRHPRPVPPRKIKSESPSHSGSSVIHMDGARASGYVQGDGKESSIGIASDSLRCLQDAYYLMILRMLGFGRNNEKTSSNLTPRSSETTSTCSGFASDVDIRNLRITQKSEGIMRGSRELLIAMLQKCSLLIRGMRAIKSRALEDTGEALPLPVFAFDDLTFSGHDMAVPAWRCYLILLSTLEMLNLSDCSRLRKLPQPFDRFRELNGLDMNNYPQLESIGWKVAAKCSGNPMCIKALAGLLCHSKIGLAEVDMLADGFVVPEEGSQPEDTGLNYFDELFFRSFFQRSPFHNDQDDKFVMHELFHDLATSVSRNECLRCEEPFCCMPESTCHLSLAPSDSKTVALTKVARNLQCFIVFRGSLPRVRILHLNDLYVKLGFLRALNLSYTDILELPGSIGSMKHLRLLALNNTNIKGLPLEIGQVDSLQTLELKNCGHLTELPKTTSNLTKLRHLDVQKEPGNIKVSMPHGIGQLTDLQTLTEFNIGNNLLQCSIVELKKLNGLRGHLHITGLENIKTAADAKQANIVNKHFLEALTLEWSYSDEGMDNGLGQENANKILLNLQPNSTLQKLVVRNYPGNLFPLWMHDSYLSNLVSVILDNCYGCSELPYLGDLPYLKSLFIQRMDYIKSFGIESNSFATDRPRFPSLEMLTLWDMYDLQFWIGTSEWDFPRICYLSISRCPKLRNLPPLRSLLHLSVHCSGEVPSFSELPSLESLKIKGFHKIRSISFPRQLTSLKKLEISDCKELSSMFAYSLSISDLKVVRCPKLDLVGSSLEDFHRQKVDSGR
ncbi:hypothetical protein HU200_015609 [Digitaria exilis]|uniref:Uncharacterized protein n=1 Tax=Digitaria exilis TaxID=1010633 RepID=A0A835KIK4_9POAL|nr:hypothetical protein HU200_015609 [Digitaria exilis]